MSQVDAQSVAEIGATSRTAISEVSGIIRQLLKSGMTSHIIAAGSMIIIADIMEKSLKILSPDAALLVKVISAAYVGSDVTGQVLSGFTHVSTADSITIVDSSGTKEELAGLIKTPVKVEK